MAKQKADGIRPMPNYNFEGTQTKFESAKKSKHKKQTSIVQISIQKPKLQDTYFQPELERTKTQFETVPSQQSVDKRSSEIVSSRHVRQRSTDSNRSSVRAYSPAQSFYRSGGIFEQKLQEVLPAANSNNNFCTFGGGQKKNTQKEEHEDNAFGKARKQSVKMVKPMNKFSD